MKRSPLKRKTRLKPMSASKQTWWRQYNDLKAKASIEEECRDCGVPYFKSHMEPHHPAGRQGANLLRFVWLCRGCHRAIHDNGKWARKTGRLLPEFGGLKSTPETINFFGV